MQSSLERERPRSLEERAALAVTFDRGAGAEETVEYRFPAIEQTFSSPLLNARNLEISGGAPWQWLVGRVVDGLKPVCFVDSPNRDEMCDAAYAALAGGAAVQFKPYRFADSGPHDHFFVSAAAAARIRDLFDLEALLADYRNYLAEAPAAFGQVRQEIDRIRWRSVSDFLNFSDVEVGHPRSAGELARCGLLLGYPVESTAALICGDLQLAGCGSFDLFGHTGRPR